MTSLNDTTQLERQLSSLFRAEAEQAHLPLGTWQAINPRMGEPNAPSVLWRLSNAISFPRWRNPMKVKYAAPAATVLLAAIAAVLFILLVNDEDEGPVPAATPTPELQTPSPRPTFTPPPATSTPEPTATVVPTATAVPTATPLPATKSFPVALQLNSEPLAEEQVVEQWTDYLGDTEVVGNNQFNTVLTLCQDGTGRIRNVGGPSAEMTWSVAKSGQSWNQVTVQVLIPGQDPTDPPDRFAWRLEHGADGLDVEEYDPVAIVDVSGERCTA